MKGSQNILYLGLLLVAFGAFIILITSGATGTGFFFIFPFIFVNTGDLVSMFILFAFVLVIFLFMMRFAVGYFNQIESEFTLRPETQYIQVGPRCDYCSEPLPLNAVFCSKCGSPVDPDKMSYQ